jgi:XTP/dITP diphosphohydrolase
MTMDLVLATRNPGKVVEIQHLLEPLHVRVLPLTSFADVPDVVEDLPTIEGNAAKKARVVSTHVGLPAMADDTALEVEHLGGRPGVYSARYAGEDQDPAANRALLLAELGGAPSRRARFRTVLAYVDGDDLHLFEGVCPGVIAEAERGDGGFGYDALFIPDGSVETFAEMELHVKNRISHRAKALQRFIAFLSDERKNHTGAP